MSSKKISFTVPDYIYDSLSKLPFLDGISVNNLFKACAINRMIDKGYLDEFGCPIDLPELKVETLPALDFSKVTEQLKRCEPENKSFNELLKERYQNIYTRSISN